jgi:hypothetical protein
LKAAASALEFVRAEAPDQLRHHRVALAQMAHGGPHRFVDGVEIGSAGIEPSHGAHYIRIS